MTEDDSSTKKMEIEPLPPKVDTGSNVSAFSYFGDFDGGSSNTGVFIDAVEHLESHRGIPIPTHFIPTVGDVTRGVKGVATNAQQAVRIFHIGDHEIFEVSQEQIDRVRTMHDRFSEGAEFSFNYNTLLLVASVLAGFGLVINSSATIIGSMLVSPIMGPVVGLAYGTTICDWKMVKRSLKTECYSLLFCILVGAVIAAITGPTELANKWPTMEMTNRGQTANFLVGLPIAFFSGLGVAVSLLDDQTNSLVGVAISASLLPPAVNAGVLWVSYAFAEGHVFKDDVGREYERIDYREMGFYSIFLTLANVLLIWISGMLMFRLKEVLPIKKKIFWDDLATARKIYQKQAVMTGSITMSQLGVLDVTREEDEEGNDNGEQDAAA